ncbi:ankyrin repeat domain-containing protein [Magnetococcales bacterium HHB-1]
MPSGELNLSFSNSKSKPTVPLTAPKKEISLHDAVFSGDCALVERLLQAGADIHAKDHQGRTPIRLAVIIYHKKMIALLIDHGAENGGFADC